MRRGQNVPGAGYPGLAGRALGRWVQQEVQQCDQNRGNDADRDEPDGPVGACYGEPDRSAYFSAQGFHAVITLSLVAASAIPAVRLMVGHQVRVDGIRGERQRARDSSDLAVAHAAPRDRIVTVGRASPPSRLVHGEGRPMVTEGWDSTRTIPPSGLRRLHPLAALEGS